MEPWPLFRRVGRIAIMQSQRSLAGLLSEIGRVLKQYVSGQVRIALLTAGLCAIGFVALKVPAWALVAALCGVFTMVPVAGVGLAMACLVIPMWIGGAELWRMAAALGVFVVVLMIKDFWLTPRLLGRNLGLRPMVVFWGLIFGGAIFGPLGVLLALPAIAVAHVCFKFLGLTQTELKPVHSKQMTDTSSRSRVP